VDLFVKKVLKCIKRRHLVREGDRLLVALSGGADSVALLLVFHELRDLLGLDLVAAHINHGLRGSDSDQDEQFSVAFCRNLEVPLQVKKFEAGLLEETVGNLEAEARRLRYEFLHQKAAADRRAILTGHTMNDQSETVLMRLIRGSGPAGLGGIPPLRETVSLESSAAATVVVRPFLEATREEILEYLERREQKYREDRSNQDRGFDRNWIRHELVPLLEERLNPQLIQTLSRSAGLFREMEEILKEQEEQVFRTCSMESSSEVSIEVEKLLGFPIFARRLAIRRAIGQVSGDLSNIDYDHIEAVLGLVDGPSGHETHLPSGLRVEIEFGRLRFTASPASPPFEYRLSVPGEIYIAELEKQVSVERSVEGGSRGPCIRWQGDGLVVRNRRPGDRYSTTGDASGRRLKKLFQEYRIPRSQRDRLVILEGGGKILWVEGLPFSAPTRGEGMEGLWEIRFRDETSGEKKLLTG